MTTIIFDSSITGHHLEYLHHIYEACTTITESHFVFVVPQKFESVKVHLVWTEANNITFDFILDDESIYSSKANKNLLARSYYTSKCLKLRVEKYGAKKVFTNNIIDLVPFAPLILGKKIEISGIIYGIYLYQWKSSKIFSKILNVLKYQIMSRFLVYSKVMILNDSASARRLNFLFKTSKFVSLPDPFIPLQTVNLIDFRKEHNIKQEKIVFAHFGGLSERKGTLNILDSISLLSTEQKANFVFVFAGKIDSDIKNIFYQKYHEIKDNAFLILKDDFCPYEYLASLCQGCDAILIPYLSTERSSGIVGYAAQFKKPVIAPASGLLGRIVKSYQLGIIIKDCKALTLVSTYTKIQDDYRLQNISKYCEINNTSNFQKVIKMNFRD